MGGSVLVGLIVVACAEGTSEDPIETPGGADAAQLEASLPGKDAALPPPPEKDAGAVESGPTVSAACTAALAKASFDFEADQGWTHVASDNALSANASWPYDGWTRGNSTTLACPDTLCWGSERTQNYSQCGRGELISPKIDLSACTGETVTLRFTHAYAFWTGSFGGTAYFDGGIVEISKDDGVTWAVPNGTYPGTVKILATRNGFDCVLPNNFHVHNKMGFTGTQTTPVTVDLEVPAASITDKMRIRFSQASGVSTEINGNARSGTAAGWRVDDVKLVVK